ncbi:exonuclease subunit SbcC, partial [Salmonella enterica subsp. enterica serovar Heidelberg str. 41565]
AVCRRRAAAKSKLYAGWGADNHPDSIARHHQEQAQYTQRLADKRLSYKTKAQELADVRTICEQEARIKDLESQRAHLQSGQP